MEYYSGSDPKTASPSTLTVTADDERQLLVRLRRSNRLASINGILQKSSDLANWIAAELPLSKAAEHPTHDTLQARLQPNDRHTFLRIALNKATP